MGKKSKGAKIGSKALKMVRISRSLKLFRIGKLYKSIN